MRTTEPSAFPWLSVMVAAAVGGGAIGFFFHYQLFILQYIGSLIAQPSILGGVVVHAPVTLIFVSVFGLAVSRTRLRSFVSGRIRMLMAGLFYGIGLFLGAFGVLFPLATRSAPAQSLPVPYWPVDGLLMHVLFGLLVGITFATLWIPRIDDG